MDSPLESTTPAESVDLGSMYRAARERIGVVIAECGPGSADVAVPACPGWTVKDVVSHLVGIIEDVNAGRLSGPPPDEQTAEEVARHRTQPMDEVLASWSELAPGFEALITQMQIWPGLLDVLSHEHDIRAALGRPGARDDRGVMLGAEQLVAGLDAPVEIVITADPAEGNGVASNDPDAPLVLRATAFEVFRLRLGRRTREQVRQLAWSRDPGDVLDQLFIFGPTTVALAE